VALSMTRSETSLKTALFICVFLLVNEKRGSGAPFGAVMYSPTGRPSLNPWPEPPPTSQLLSVSGWLSSKESPLRCVLAHSRTEQWRVGQSGNRRQICPIAQAHCQSRFDQDHQGRMPNHACLKAPLRRCQSGQAIHSALVKWPDWYSCSR